MGDHFVLLVDRLLTESTLEAAIERRNQPREVTNSASQALITDISSHKLDMDSGLSLGKLVECRICHDEDDDSKMETPCSCCGSLKYAHRGCVQRWCNEKGDTTCEICHQQFMPNYTAPPPLFHYGGIPMNFRGNWEISRRGIHDPPFIAMVATDRNFMDPEFDDYSATTPRSLIWCRVVAMIFLILLVLRHTLPVIINGAEEYSLTLLALMMLRTIGILLPIYAVVRAYTVVQRRRHQQVLRSSSLDASDEENELYQLGHQPHFIRVQ